jgi:2-dehydro-3-deoxyphosphogluconate aldolase / (4S)-4-hydroxy-2-oxoglutarate aldolase
VLKACYDGGGRLLEFTNRGVGAHEVFAALNQYAAQELPGMALGVGSVADAPTAALFLQLGASFVVGPSLREDVAKVCNRRRVPYLPGCGSLTEIGQAEELGCEVVKLFPGEVYGPKFIAAVRGPQPWTKIMPTGGVSPDADNLKQWFGAGAFCVGMGSKLISNERVAQGRFGEIEAEVRQALGLIQNILQP